MLLIIPHRWVELMVAKKKSVKKKSEKKRETAKKRVKPLKKSSRKAPKKMPRKKKPKKKVKVKQKRSKPAKNMTERVQRKWLYQCAYWRICGSCSMREHCAKLVKELGIEKSWLTDQILETPEKEVEAVKVKTNSRFLTEEEWLKQ